ncbi:hypothetical protein scyTo_0023773, partial [Scyliorhinus torazame]|nr:hypothetical protein [Scyliorhinus torazame]
VDLGHRMMKIGTEERDVFGIERTIYAEENGPMSWQCNFLSDGHLTSRVQVGSPVTMVLTHVPHMKQIGTVIFIHAALLEGIMIFIHTEGC